MLGHRIALLRRGFGWSQAALAKRLHISPSAVGMYEQGRREPSLEALMDLSQVFGVSVDYLLTGKILCQTDQQVLDRVLQANVQQIPASKGQRFSREELAVLFAAMLTEA